ncbi:outer membrane protein assembly factor [Hymenobacter latericus]|uniref:outer membrane protein assembly factor n=1 Tax=Hymenobacter sp. YIM 151858-1 TaxID=2987688 RepID=UPI0022263E39|nr:outer membrane protein assembly factor [Hymenobacter sp. YIM 151858-1]UYZ59906.1 outer membrane protein assembly factor [Hymenobacter sp. YIM 151858-1]
MQLAALVLTLGCPLLAHAATTAPAWAPDSAKVRRVGVLPVPAIGYAPETRGYLGAVALFTLRLYPNDSLTRTSNAKLEVNFTQNRQRIFSGEWTVLLRREQYLSQGQVAYLRFPEYFWGVGNQSPESAKELVDSRRVEVRATALRKLRPYVFAGPRVQLQHLYGVRPAAGGLLEGGQPVGSRGGTSSGAGYELVYDGRDNLLNPQRRGYARLAQTFFGGWLGSDFRFTRYELDVRRYQRLGKRVVLAGQVTGVFHSGEPPFRMLALLGSEADMRGYYRGRFRDRQYAAAQAELRFPVYKRLGAVAFAGGGQVARNLGGFGPNALKPTAGAGLRFLMDRRENINLRLDYAIGQDGSSGFYIAFGEAF